MKKYPPKKVFILQNGNYIEITFNEYCDRAEKDDTYKKMLFIPLHGVLMEVTPVTYEEFYREERRQKYLKEISVENDDFSYDSLTTDEFNGEDILLDEGEPVDELAIKNIMIERLRFAISLLSKEEKDLLIALFFNELPERKISQILGIPQTTINYRKRAILKKLKNFFEK